MASVGISPSIVNLTVIADTSTAPTTLSVTLVKTGKGRNRITTCDYGDSEYLRVGENVNNIVLDPIESGYQYRVKAINGM